ncbi:DUF4127 family protein [Dyadobacter frigoris]|uniref:DUF4127 family protein n=1 Tax=Dyadobacter frigoris TaxID=2576211 RepID=A0A4U6CTM5_9BACT|nr:DUF4127 family protein [Dyadobacter frigoris]TKT87586.1 DUF4127 family protein [Dyadobacter frigoris]GLU52645.1 hypothetical protein Dfri01_21060 [Dyadobacter frigoris]
MKKYIVLTFILVSVSLNMSARDRSSLRSKILFIPLDNRPPCLKMPEKMGLIADAQVVSPPEALLGNLQQPGQCEKINAWILAQDLKSYDAAIIVLDMVAYGGLVASRKFMCESSEALSRIQVIEQIRKRAPKLKIYGQSVIMRLAPSADGKNEAYREKLASWAKISPDQDEKTKAQVLKLEADIPAAVLADYKKARARNYSTNLKAIEMVKTGLIDYLILSQDDASPKGVHLVDRENLIKRRDLLKLTDRIAIQSGADEVSMLLLARALNKQYRFFPSIKVVYCSEKLKNTVMPFEDRILSETVSHHIKATGSVQVENESQADILFYVYPSRYESGGAETFADEIQQKIKAGKRIIVADIDPVGNIQGEDSLFTQALLSRHVFSGLYGYASWNTAGNTIGTALPHGIVYDLAATKLSKNKAAASRIKIAQNWFMINRVMDDYYYHNLVRAKANTFLSGKKLPSATLMSGPDNQKVESYCLGLLENHMDVFFKSYFTQNEQLQTQVKCQPPTDLSFKLPWNRTFEADIDFSLSCQ